MIIIHKVKFVNQSDSLLKKAEIFISALSVYSVLFAELILANSAEGTFKILG